ncbi:MAG: hypothetical protein NTY31_02510 [Candidatus Falkowbacteria bacterium]|nr:hypothetical protein [Candidatus Falkowbacteria bacterium]
MNIKKYLSLVFVLTFLIVGARTVKADDGGPNSAFWVIDHKTNCVSVINPEATGANAFLVFDYSAKVGQTRGKPWTIVEKGKCYEVDDGTEDMYLIKIVKGNERDVFSNYTSYNSTDSIPQIFCKDNASNNQYHDYDYSTTTLGYSITPMRFLGENSVTTTASELIHFTGITANALSPTKYDFGFPVTSFSSMMPEELKPIVNYPSFVSASNLYISLAKQLVSTLQSCDTRVRVERQYNFFDVKGDYSFLDVKNIVWRLANNKDVIVQTSNRQFNDGVPSNIIESKPDLLNEVDLMGCKTAFSGFIQAHQTDFSTIDRLAQEVIAKYPSALKKGENDYLSPISLKNSAETSKILAFANNSSTTSGIVTTPPTQTPQVVTPTVLDEPTPEKKIDLLVNSKNPLMRAYVYLPILALVGIIIFFLLKKRQK